MMSKIDKTLLNILHNDKVEQFDSYSETDVIFFPKIQKAMVCDIHGNESWYDCENIEEALMQYNADQTPWVMKQEQWMAERDRWMHDCEERYEDEVRQLELI